MDPLRVLGYGAAIPALEIETFDKNKVCIKHCLTNITLQFDVLVHNESNEKAIKHQKSTLLLPKDVKGTKLIQYKNTILNTMLPAELCRIIPNMIRTMTTLWTEEMFSKNLRIRELSCTENLSLLQNSSVLKIRKSLKIRRFIEGSFTTSNQLRSVTTKSKPHEHFTGNLNIKKLLPNLKNKILIYNTPSLQKSIPDKRFTSIESIPLNQTLVTTALVPYASNQSLVAISKQHEFPTVDIIRNFYKYKAGLTRNSSLHFINCIYDRFNKNINLSLNVTAQGIKKNVHITINNLNFENLLYNKMSQSIQPRLTTCVKKSIEYFENLSSQIKNEKALKHFSPRYRKKKRTATLYSRCKSLSNVSAINNSNALNEVLTIEDYCQLIGSQSLSSVFDSNATKKIFASLSEVC